MRRAKSSKQANGLYTVHLYRENGHLIGPWADVTADDAKALVHNWKRRGYISSERPGLYFLSSTDTKHKVLVFVKNGSHISEIPKISLGVKK